MALPVPTRSWRILRSSSPIKVYRPSGLAGHARFQYWRLGYPPPAMASAATRLQDLAVHLLCPWSPRAKLLAQQRTGLIGKGGRGIVASMMIFLASSTVMPFDSALSRSCPHRHRGCRTVHGGPRPPSCLDRSCAACLPFSSYPAEVLTLGLPRTHPSGQHAHSSQSTFSSAALMPHWRPCPSNLSRDKACA